MPRSRSSARASPSPPRSSASSLRSDRSDDDQPARIEFDAAVEALGGSPAIAAERAFNRVAVRQRAGIARRTGSTAAGAEREDRRFRRIAADSLVDESDAVPFCPGLD